MQTQLPNRLLPFTWRFLKPYRTPMVIFVLAAIIAGFWGPGNSLLIKKLINLLPEVQGGDVSALWLPAALLVLNFFIFDNVTWRTTEFISYLYQGEIKNQMIRDTLDHVYGESHQFFQDNLSGRIANQITTLADNLTQIIDRISLDFIRGTSQLLLTFITCYFVNPAFFYVSAIWFVFFCSFSLMLSKRFVVLADRHAEQESLVAGQIVDGITNHNNIRLFSGKTFELRRMNIFLSKVLKTFKKSKAFSMFLYGGQGSLIAIMMGFSVYYLVHYYALGEVDAGDFALILGLMMFLGHMVWYTMTRVDDFNQAYGKCKQSLQALMRYPEIRDKENAKPLTVTKGEITFAGVQFHYKGNEPLFQNKTITIKAGQKVGLVGYSGGGKTTFAHLILRLYDVVDGRILIDDQNIQTVTQDSLRSNISMIPQDPSLFHRSLMDNIRYGKFDATDEEVIAAAQKAHVDEFIQQLPKGYASLVGERGIKLSGGQRQRIAIARAILKNAPILILDEATSQLDSVTEGLIQESLWALMQNKTTLVIAHRLSTLLHMDRILVFDKGRIVQDGPHKRLRHCLSHT